mmetsp:Transcript_4378/g.13085  ORF Transcript_4378/g.13085 Transcript_4378/m.13085 type:complete len:305 (+) Transcript_4378:1199-2113(+)
MRPASSCLRPSSSPQMFSVASEPARTASRSSERPAARPSSRARSRLRCARSVWMAATCDRVSMMEAFRWSAKDETLRSRARCSCVATPFSCSSRACSLPSASSSSGGCWPPASAAGSACGSSAPASSLAAWPPCACFAMEVCTFMRWTARRAASIVAAISCCSLRNSSEAKLAVAAAACSCWLFSPAVRLARRSSLPRRWPSRPSCWPAVAASARRRRRTSAKPACCSLATRHHCAMASACCTPVSASSRRSFSSVSSSGAAEGGAAASGAGASSPGPSGAPAPEAACRASRRPRHRAPHIACD